MLTIEVRLLSQQAIEQAKALQESLKSVQNSTSGAGAAAAQSGGAFVGAMTNLEKFGKNLQWTGRQLTYNFTLPLVIAGGAATKWALANDAAMTNVAKAYGAFDTSAQDTQGELKALATSFELLSDRFGVNQAEVINIAYEWAQAGAAGVALAKATKLTLETMALTGEDASKAAEQLLTIQSAYKLNTDQLRTSLEALNAVQVTTAVEFGGLIDAVSRAAGSASAAGIDMNHLAAMTAALVPATGSASAAGNALRTMISRLMAPTKQAADELGLLGINVNDASWQALNGVERFEKLGQAWTGLSDAQKNLVSSVIASRWQINRFDVLMNDITSSTGVYQKALANTSDTVAAHAQYTQMLATVLGSTSSGFHILTTNIQNALSKAIVPLLPALTGLLNLVLKLVTAFTNLDPNLQQLILTMLVMLALVGPVTKYIGAFTTLIGLLGNAFALVGDAAIGFFGFIADGFEMIISLPMLFIKGIWSMIAAFGEAIGSVSAGLIAIPEAIAGALGISVSAVVLAIAAIVGLVAVIFRQQLGGAIQWVIDAFWQLPRAVTNVFISIVEVIKNAAMKIRDWLSYINPFARHSPSLVDNVHKGSAVIKKSYSQMGDHVQDQISGAQDAQKDFQDATDPLSGAKNQTKAEHIIQVLPNSADAVWAMVKAMDALKVSTAAAKAEMKAQQDIVDNMKKQIDTDMKPYNDAILMNSMAQKQVRLEIMKAEDAAGGSIDKIKQKMAMAQGQIESLQSEKTSLRLAGAGSDILSGFDSQIGAARGEQQGLRAKADAIQELQDKLDKLQRSGEELQLEKDIKFDPQLAALQAQQDKLDSLKDTYNLLNDQLTEMQSNFDAIASAADAAISAAKAAASGPADSLNSTEFAAAADSNFPDVGGTTIPGIGREGGLPEIQDFNKQLEDELNKALDGLGSFDIFKPLKDAWNTVWAWIADTVGPYLTPIIDKIKHLFDGLNFSGISLGGLWDDFLAGLDKIGSIISDSPIGTGLEAIADGAKALWEVLKLVGGFLVDILGPPIAFLWDEIKKFGDAITGELSQWAPVWGKLTEAVGHIFNVFLLLVGGLLTDLATAIGVAMIAIEAIWSFAWPFLEDVLKPILDSTIGLVVAALEIIRGIISFVLDVINGDWGAAWTDILTIVTGVWDAIYAVVSRAIGFVLGTVEGFIDGIIGFFQWLYDQLVGHSIIPDLVNAIIVLFQFLSDTVGAIWNAFMTILQVAWDTIGQPMLDTISAALTFLQDNVFTPILDTIGTLWSDLILGLQIEWDTVGQPILDGINTALTFLQDSVFTPILDTIGTLWSDLIAGLKIEWDTVGQPILDAINTALTFIKDNVFQPILDTIGTLWSDMIAGFGIEWDTIGKPILDAIGTAFGAIKDTIKSVFDGIKDIISTTWSTIGGIIETGVNAMIDVFNFLGSAINAITGPLGLFTIGTISHVNLTGGGGGGGMRGVPGGTSAPGLAMGGIPNAALGGPGFVTNVPVAIVGEGRSAYDEFVIPTDPQYRDRALQLYAALGTRLLDLGGTVSGAISGIIDAGGNPIGALTGPLSGAASDAIQAFWDAIGDATGLLGNMSGWAADAGNSMKDKVIDWGKSKFAELASTLVDTITGGSAGDLVGHPAPGTLSSIQSMVKGLAQVQHGWSGGEWDSLYNLLMGESGFNPNAKNPTSSAYGLFQFLDSTWATVGGHKTSDPLLQTQYGLNYIAQRYGDPIGAYSFWLRQSPHWYEQGGLIPGLANGGIVLPRPGGTLVRLGEGSHAEMVQPLRHDGNYGDTTYIFNGDLSFPNITKPSDAKKFLTNLENVGTR